MMEIYKWICRANAQSSTKRLVCFAVAMHSRLADAIGRPFFATFHFLYIVPGSSCTHTACRRRGRFLFHLWLVQVILRTTTMFICTTRLLNFYSFTHLVLWLPLLSCCFAKPTLAVLFTVHPPSNSTVLRPQYPWADLLAIALFLNTFFLRLKGDDRVVFISSGLFFPSVDV